MKLTRGWAGAILGRPMNALRAICPFTAVVVFST
jgi:hypothetical protein